MTMVNSGLKGLMLIPCYLQNTYIVQLQVLSGPLQKYPQTRLLLIEIVMKPSWQHSSFLVNQDGIQDGL